VQGKKKLKNRNNNNYNPSIAPFFFVEWKKSKIHQTDERSDRAKKSITARREIRQSFLQDPPQEKQNKTQIPTERNLYLP
jgi:hypothetical protein